MSAERFNETKLLPSGPFSKLPQLYRGNVPSFPPSSRNCNRGKKHKSKLFLLLFVFCTYKLCFFFSAFITQTVEHGFPHQPSALAFDPKLQLMAIGTKSGAIKVYPLPFFFNRLLLVRT